MGDYQFFVLSSLGLLTFIVVISAAILKKKLGIMHGMIISMFYGMNVGLTAGVLLGVTYQGDLFLSTILSMAIGVLAGSLCGVCFGTLSVVEGFMAGLMGGMMGAMVGEMIRVDQSINLIQIFLLLSVSTLFIIPILKTAKDSKVSTKKWMLKPLTLAAFTVLIVIGGDSIAERFEDQKSGQTKPAESHQRKGQTVVLETANMKYSKSLVVVEKDIPITLTLKNMDDIEHDIEIRSTAIKLISESLHNHGENKNMLHLHATPESTETLSFTITESGVYEFYCTIPGHKELGMVGQFIVS
ncbi:plastocyanin/azurin family copper-binding protein [Sporosarcina sp. P33]|uniref:plastocyanin/azurin family copper-binding protein n=1 Tax=Sporosarcina sp. P33 TaxID=1930764 RepID=UPI0009BEB2D4|nr:plastocyanin/azurin family copper-binding protein [Sporosarcina sp. P33]ARD47537.1 copper-binding protein [Sporosarcina sp. P33]